MGGSDRLWVVRPRGGAGAVPVPATRHRGPSGRRTGGRALRHGSNNWQSYTLQGAGGVRLLVAPHVLCDLYRGLNEFDDTSHIGKFARRPFICQDLAGVTRTLLRMDDLRQNFYRVVAFPESTYSKNSSVGLFVDEHDFFLSLQPCLLPMRDGGTFHVEPYFPYKFNRKFGYDQGVLEHLAMISHEAREVGVGSSSWYSLFSRFREVSSSCDMLFPSPKRSVHASFEYASWYSCTIIKVARWQLPKQQLYAFKPWDLSLPYYYCTDRGFEEMMGAEPGIEMTSPARILWMDLARAPETSTGRIHHVIGWLGIGDHRLLFYDPLVEEEEFQMREPEARSCASSTWL
ncbi:hypothetical protein ACLOJK_014803, partial [Asimina triloba]